MRVSSNVMATRQSRSYLLLLWLMCLFTTAASAESVKDIAAPTNYVTDLAGVLNASTQADLNALCRSVDVQAHAQIFVVTVHKIDDDEPIEQFANDLFAKWKIGPAKTDRGILLLLSAEDHRYRMEVGFGLEGILPDGKTGDIGRDMVPDLKDGNYDGAVRTAVNEIAQVVAQDAGITLTQPVHTYHRTGSNSASGGSRIFGILFLLVFLFFIFRGGGRGGRGGGGGGFLSGLLLGGLMGGGRGYGGSGYSGCFDGGGGGDSGGSFGCGEGCSSGGGGASGSW